MKTVSDDDAKSRLSALLAEIESDGQRIVICRNGAPIADLVPHRGKVSMAADPMLGAIVMHYDPTEELTETDWPTEERSGFTRP